MSSGSSQIVSYIDAQMNKLRRDIDIRLSILTTDIAKMIDDRQRRSTDDHLSHFNDSSIAADS